MTQDVSSLLKAKLDNYSPPPKQYGPRDLIASHYTEIRNARQKGLPWSDIASALGTTVSVSTLKRYFYEESSARKRRHRTRHRSNVSPPAPEDKPMRLSDFGPGNNSLPASGAIDGELFSS